MVQVRFTENLSRHVGVAPCEVAGSTVCDALDAVFARYPRARGYFLDDQGALRKHVNVFIDGQPVRDRRGLRDSIGENTELYLMQALSGG
jgi:molybdopterin converting factor small subunit